MTMMKRQRIVLDIAYGAATGIADPARWDWNALLDLGPNESAVCVNWTEVNEGEKPATPLFALADARMLTGRKPQ